MEPRLPPQIEGPFRGMLVNSDVETQPGFVDYLQNFIIRDGRFVARPGIVQIGATLAGDVQGIYQWQMLNGTQYTCAFANGDLYVYSWSGGTWTLYDLSVAGLTVSTTGDINCATSRGRLIFTDGVNKPVMVVGPVGSIAYTTLTNAPVAHRVGVYYDKVFFWDIPSYENEFQWSDEGDPANGYSGDNQAWEFAQTDAGRIIGMAPLNERMDVLKEDSATMLMGSVDENFSTLAVREGLSETEGAIAGGSVVILDGDVYCVSVNGPRRVRAGQVYESLHEGGGVDYLRDFWDTVDVSELAGTLGFVDKQEKMVGMLLAIGTAARDTALIFNKKSGSYSIFTFTGFDMTAAGSVEDNTGLEWVLFGDVDGKVYSYRVGSGVDDDDGTAIEYKIRGRSMGGEAPLIRKRLIEVHFDFECAGNFEGEIRPRVDDVTLDGKRFGRRGSSAKKTYRRGFNAVGYKVGWELYANVVDQAITLTKYVQFMSVVESGDNWAT